MIKCYINGNEVFPSLKNGLKMVIENPNMRDKSSYTYDITFPMDILENVKCFSGISRASVTVRNRTFEDCRLMANDKLLFQGKGIVSMVNNEEVKLQIVQEEKSNIPSVFSSSYIDLLEYPAVNSRYKQAVFDDGGSSFDGDGHGLIDWTDVKTELQENRFLGEQGKYTFIMTLKGDATGEDIEDFVNVCCCNDEGYAWPLYHLAVQPNLMYVLRQVLASAGYSADLSAIDCEPWNDLYICSCNITLDIAEALPHWTCKKFLEEIEKLFNISFEWNTGYVRAVKLWEREASQTVEIETEDEFERNYDEEGQAYADTSNLTYNLGDTHDPKDTVSREAVQKYGVRRYPSMAALEAALQTMTEKEKKTSFFAISERPELYYFHESTEESDTDCLKPTGLFRPMFRDLDSDSTTDLNITPVAIENEDSPFWPILRNYPGGGHDPRFYMINVYRAVFQYPVTQPKEIHDDYVSVQDVVEEGSGIDDDEDTSQMDIMFVSPLNTADVPVIIDHQVAPYGQYSSMQTVTVPKAKTDDHLFRTGEKNASLALNGCTTMICMGDNHVTQLQIDQASAFNKNEELITKFLSDDVPPVSRVFVIANKRYIAKQLEIQVNEDGVAHEITGHFYELLQ